jgi:hypothetical protein
VYNAEIMATETQKIGVGGLLMIISTALILGVTTLTGTMASVLSGIASLVMVAGTLILGLSEDGAGV